jgi:hypothetical protein
VSVRERPVSPESDPVLISSAGIRVVEGIGIWERSHLPGCNSQYCERKQIRQSTDLDLSVLVGTSATRMVQVQIQRLEREVFRPGQARQ